MSKQMSNENCLKCGSKLEIVHSNELYCEKCIHYKINGKWMHIWCDEYHRHSSKCLVEIHELNK